MISLMEHVSGPGRYQIRIELAWSKPPIWRRVIVRADMRLNRLHKVIQLAMGWTDTHLHHFVVGETFYGVPDPEMDVFGSGTLNEKKHTVAELAAGAGEKFIYEYDFGDGWTHECVVEKVLPPDPAFKHPVCVGGALACPPEDCGGIHGYYALLAALADPKHPNHAERSEWIGRELDAEAFDVEEVNAVLKRMKA